MHVMFDRIFIALIIAFTFALDGGSVLATPVGQSAPLNDGSGLNITSSGSNVARSAGARAADEINGLDYSTFAAAVAQATSVSKVLRLPPGSYTYTSATALTVSTPVIFEPGAVLACSGANVAFTGAVQAPRLQIFASGCTPSFWGNIYQVLAYPEWWGAVGNATGVSGVGTDSTAAFANALASGVAQISLAGGANYRYSTLPTTRSHVSLIGADRGSTTMSQDDPTGALDGLFFSGGSGQNSIREIGFSRDQSGIGSVAAAEIVAGGTGYAVNDTVTIAGGASTTAAVLKVTSVSSGAITGLSVQTPGAYTLAAPPTQTMTITPAVAQGSTSGGGTGATFKLLWQGPALLHLQDVYYVNVEHNTFAGSYSWDQIRLDDVSGSDSQVYINHNQIFGANHDNIFLYGPSSSYKAGDVWVDQKYITQAKYAGYEVRGYTGGLYANLNVVYEDNYGFYWDGDVSNLIPASKIRSNDIDSNTAGNYFFGFGESHFQQNWMSNPGPLVFTNSINLQGEGNVFTASTTNAIVYFNGGASINFPANHFSGGLGGAIMLSPYNGAPPNEINLTGEDWSYGSGYCLNWSGTPSNVTIGCTITGGAQGVTNPSAQMTNLTVIGNQSSSNNSVSGFGAILYGQNNTVGQSESAAGGQYNSVYGFGSTAFGSSNSVGGAYSNVRGLYASDDSLWGADCTASGSTGNTAGSQEHCTHVLRARSTAASATRLTADGNGAGAANCINLPADSAMSFSIRVIGFNSSSTAAVSWVSNGANLLVHNSGATVAYGGDFSTATLGSASPTYTMSAAYTGGGAATLQLSGDPTNSCLNVTVVPPDATTWNWAAYVSRVKMQ